MKQEQQQQQRQQQQLFRPHTTTIIGGEVAACYTCWMGVRRGGGLESGTICKSNTLLAFAQGPRCEYTETLLAGISNCIAQRTHSNPVRCLKALAMSFCSSTVGHSRTCPNLSRMSFTTDMVCLVTHPSDMSNRIAVARTPAPCPNRYKAIATRSQG